MNNIILHPTATSQWYELIAEASASNNSTFHEDVASYLAFLLMRFTTSADIGQKIMALALLDSVHQYHTKKQKTLRDVGDTCLLFAGLFPARAARRRVNVSYYVDLGQAAYLSLADYTGPCHNDKLAKIFAALGENFVPLMEALQIMRGINKEQLILDIADDAFDELII